MQLIDNAIRGSTDIPVRFIGIQEQGFGQSSAMFNNTTMTWLRETDGNEPSNSWSVPIPSRPAADVYYRDAIILDHNNEFVSVQNLTSEPISSNQANLDKFVAAIRAAATTEDTDADRIPDHWERDNFGNLDATANTPANNLPAHGAFAPGGVPAPFTISHSTSRPFIFTFRNRIGRAADGLIYQLQTSTDAGKTWTYTGANWRSTGAYTAYDGTGTRVNSFSYIPSINTGPDTLFRLFIGTN